MALSKTQKLVMKVLIDNPNIWLTDLEIKEKGHINNSSYIKKALLNFMKRDYVFFDGNNKFRASPEGINAYYEY